MRCSMFGRLCNLAMATMGRKPVSDPAVQFLRYIISGGLAFVCDYATMFLLTEYAGMHYLLSSAFGFAIGLIITYLLSIWWIFDQRRADSRIIEFAAFGVIALTGIGLNLAFMWIFTEMCSIHYLVSKLVTTVLVSVWNFILKKKILFTRY